VRERRIPKASKDKEDEITRRKPNKKEMYEKTHVDGVFLARQTLEEERLIKRYHRWYGVLWNTKFVNTRSEHQIME
jgi:hypothetical protein